MQDQNSPAQSMPIRQFADHSRDWQQSCGKRNLYVYPVISRRSGGVSVGINLNPDKACNFDCVYCQVDRSTPVNAGASTANTSSSTPVTRQVELGELRTELVNMLTAVRTGTLFDDPAFVDVPTALRGLQDIAFSGDGEPTTCKSFTECVALVAQVKRQYGYAEVPMVLITDACYLNTPAVEAGLAIMDANSGRIWAKLDAGTESYYQQVNKPNKPLAHVIANIIHTAQTRPVVIQSLFMRLHGEAPAKAEITAYIERLEEIMQAGGRLDYVQVYTVARPPAQDYVTALSNSEVDQIVERVHQETGLRTESFYCTG